MTDPETGNIIIFNGEIYNFQALRRELDRTEPGSARARTLRSSSRPTRRWGRDWWLTCEECSHSPCGTPREETLLLARDRLGIKPLYLGSVARPGRQAHAALRVRGPRAASERLSSSAISIRSRSPSYVWNGFVIGPNTIVHGVELASCGHLRGRLRRLADAQPPALLAPAGGARPAPSEGGARGQLCRGRADAPRQRRARSASSCPAESTRAPLPRSPCVPAHARSGRSTSASTRPPMTSRGTRARWRGR